LHLRRRSRPRHPRRRQILRRRTACIAHPGFLPFLGVTNTSMVAFPLTSTVFFSPFHPLCAQSYVSWVLGIRTVTAAGLLSFWEPGTGVSMSLSFFLYFSFQGL